MKNYLSLFLIFITTSFCVAQNPILWGYALQGGSYNYGIILNYNAITSTETDEHNFAGSPNDGQLPFTALLKANNGLLYGLANLGGTYGGGVIFSYNINTGKEIILYNFGNGTDGVAPEGSLIQASNSLLYGMTGGGGGYNKGTLFSYNISTGVETNLHNFGSGADGAVPLGTLLQANNGLLYGVVGNNTLGNNGLIFNYNISNGNYTILHVFGSGTDGQEPEGSLIQARNGLLYGMTEQGGINDTAIHGDGTIYSYNISTGIESVVHSFGNSTDGKNPWQGSLIQATDSLLYGMTRYGGNGDTADYGGGVIFSYSISIGIETVVHNFGNGTDGRWPNGSLSQASNGLLYGMTNSGGINTLGTIFSYNITTGIEINLHDFGSGTDGIIPWGSFIEVDTATVYVAPATICVGSSILLTAQGSSTYTWSPATGLNATTGDSVIANPHVTTTYTVTGTGAIPTYPTTVVVTVNPKPVIMVNIPAPACAGQSVDLMATGGTTYTWAPATGLNKTTGSSVVANPTANVTYTVIGSSKGCADTTQTAISVIAAPPLLIQPVSPTICSGQSDTLYVSGGGAGFTWSPSIGLSTSTGSSVVASPVTDVTYTVTGTDSIGCIATGTDAISVATPPNQPIITISQSGDTLFSSAQNGNQWYRNGTVIKGATDSFLVIKGLPSDTYKVEVSNAANGCSSISDSVITTGIDQLSVNNNQVSIYPDPTTGQFTIKSQNNQNGYILEVYNVLGEKIYQSTLTNSQNTINLSSEPSGLYLVYLKSQNDVEVGKVMVTK